MNTIVEFKTVSPLFEMERDGIKPFTTRKLDIMDERRSAIFNPLVNVEIKIINPSTGESFTREVTHYSYVYFTNNEWINIHWKQEVTDGK